METTAYGVAKLAPLDGRLTAPSVMNARRIVAVANLKGGSGKSTTAVNLAAVLADRGARVLVVDLDGAQATASRWLGAEGEGDELLDVYRNGAPLERAIIPARVPGVDVAAPSPALRDDTLAAYPLAVTALQRAVRTLLPGYEWVVIDTPPALGVLSVSATLLRILRQPDARRAP